MMIFLKHLNNFYGGIIINLNFLLKSNYNFKKAKLYKKAYNLILKTDLFDEKFYNENYSNYFSDDPLEHYLFEGFKKGFDPSIKFSTNKYLTKYKNVKKAKLNPLVHYVIYGKNEGKEIFDSELVNKNHIINLNKLYLNNYHFNEEPLVSIIVLNKNGLHHLKRLFKDFYKKTNYSNFEFILVDNDSDDESVNYVKSLNLSFPITIVENNENYSFSKANNEACKIANGEYILLLNNDIEPTFGWLNEMMGVMLKYDNVGSVGAKLVFPYYPNSKKHSFKTQHGGDIFGFRKKPYNIYAYNQNKFSPVFDSKVNYFKKVISVTAACILIKKIVYEEVGGLDEGYIYGYEDVDFSLKLNQKGYDVFYCPSALLFHHESSTRKVGDNLNNNHFRLNNKWSNYLNKNMLLDKIYNNKFFCELPLKFLFVIENMDNIPESALKLVKMFHSKNYLIDLEDNYINPKVDDSVDVLISFTPKLNSDIELRENIIKILFFDGYNSDFYDFITVDSENIMSNLEGYVLEKYD